MPNNNENKMAARPVDHNKDGVITDREVELEIKLEKAETQMKLARIALIAMILMAGFLVSPWGPSVEKLAALDATLATFFVAKASVVGAYMGFSSWMSKN